MYFALIGISGSDNSYADATGTVIRADGSIRVTAETIQELLSAAGSVAVSGSGAGVGAGCGCSNRFPPCMAEAGKNAVLDALGKTPDKRKLRFHECIGCDDRYTGHERKRCKDKL